MTGLQGTKILGQYYCGCVWEGVVSGLSRACCHPLCRWHLPASWLPDGTEDGQVRICCAEARCSLSCNLVFSGSRLGQQPTRLSWFSGLQTEYLGMLRLHTTCICICVHTCAHIGMCIYPIDSVSLESPNTTINVNRYQVF